MVNHNLLVRMQPFQNLAALPVPKDKVTLSVTRRNESSIWGKPDRTGVSGNSMTGEPFLAVLSEVVCRIDEDLIVERLSSKPFFYERVHEQESETRADM